MPETIRYANVTLASIIGSQNRGWCLVYAATTRNTWYITEPHRELGGDVVLRSGSLQAAQQREAVGTTDGYSRPDRNGAMVQMIEMLLLFEVLLRVYRGNGCAARGPAGFVQSALTRRIFLSDGNVEATSNTREKSRNPLCKIPEFQSFAPYKNFNNNVHQHTGDGFIKCHELLD